MKLRINTRKYSWFKKKKSNFPCYSYCEMSVQPHCGKAKLLDHLISRPLTDHPYFPFQAPYHGAIFLLTTVKCFTFSET